MKKRKAKKVAPKKVPVTPKTNTLFPGRSGYVGPQRGYFGFVHHGKLFEKATEDMTERVRYIKTMKPTNEKSIRLRHLIYLGKALGTLIHDHNRNARSHDNEAIFNPAIRKRVLAYAKRHIKPLRWDDSGSGTLTCRDGTAMTG